MDMCNNEAVLTRRVMYKSLSSKLLSKISRRMKGNKKPFSTMSINIDINFCNFLYLIKNS